MFFRRGCLFGCGGWLLLCVIAALLGWFVVVPRVADVLEDSVADGLATVISDEIDPMFSRSELQQGATVEFSFETINRELRSSNQNGNLDSVVITSSGNQLVMRADINNQSFEFAYIPRVTQDGRLELESVDEGGWWQRQAMGVLGGGFETAINRWLQENGLRLEDVSLDGDTIILHVTGE